jgi:outer membrane protein assembly factor BamB
MDSEELVASIPQNVGQPIASSSRTVGPVLSNISTPIPQILGQPSSSMSKSSSGGLAKAPWPMFRQNLNHTGLSPYDTTANSGKLKWSFTTGWYVTSSPAIGSDGTVYVGSEDFKLYAINSDGSEKWNYAVAGGVPSSPAIGSDGTIYFGSYDHKLYAINPDGTEKWSFTTGSLVYSSPTIGSDGTIYIGSYNGKLYAINPDGTEKWNFTTGTNVKSSPAINSDGTIYVGSNDGKLYAINLDGTEKWNFTTGSSVFSSPAIGPDGTIYIGSYNHKVYAINPNGTEKWNFTTGYEVKSSPAIAPDGTIYIGSHDDNLYAFNPDGTEKWSFTTGNDVKSSPAIGFDGTIYVGSEDNKLYAINLDGTEKWSFTTGDWVISSPAIGSDGTIYVGSNDHNLYAIGTSDQPPIANAGPDQTINEGEQALFDISNSYDPDGDIVKYDLDFGDGTNYTWEPSTTNVTGKDILVYVTQAYGAYNRTFFDEDLPRVLEEEGFNPVISGPDHIEEITSDILVNYDQLWILSTNSSSHGIFSTSEIDVILDFQANGGGVLVMADHSNEVGGHTTDANQISTNFGVVFSGLVNHGHSLIDPFIVDHPVNKDVDTIWGHQSEADLTITNSDLEVIAVNNGYTMIAVMDVENEGRMVFDTSFTRMEDGDEPMGHHILQGDNVQYAKNIAKWLGEGFASDTPPLINHIYGDDGFYIVTLRVTDNDNLSATDTCNITVQNVDPTVTIDSITMDVEIGLKVAGRKYNNVNMTLYEEGIEIGNVSIERMAGSPDEQIVWIPVNINFSKSYNATVTYTPKDPPNVGGNPVWIYIKSKDGSINKIHHTFNVQQSKKRDSEHWNHVEPWEVDLNGHFIGLPFEITSHITDPGSDDEILTFIYGSQVKIVTYLNNPPNPDPYPSPEVKPMDIIDTITLFYEGPGTVMLMVEDDDGGLGIATLDIS